MSQILDNAKEKGICKGKIVYLEALRILAIYCVMFNHAGARGGSYYQYTDSHICYFIGLICAIFCNIGVPLFLMISGALLLEKDESILDTYKKRLPRIVIVLVLFSFVRYIYECFGVKELEFSFSGFFYGLLKGDLFVPYWYLYIYICVLIVLPFVRKMVKNLTVIEARLFIVACCFFYIALTIADTLLGINIDLGFLFGRHLAFLITGYIIEHYQTELLGTTKSFVIALLAFVISMLGMYVTKDSELLCYPLTVSVFILFKYIDWGDGLVARLVASGGAGVFGLYLLEDYFRNLTIGISDVLSECITTLPATFIWLFVVLVVGLFITNLLKKAPGLRKLL